MIANSLRLRQPLAVVLPPGRLCPRKTIRTRAVKTRKGRTRAGFAPEAPRLSTHGAVSLEAARR